MKTNISLCRRLFYFCLPLFLVFASGCDDDAPWNGLAFSPDGKKLAWIDRDRAGVLLRNVEAGQAKRLYVADEHVMVEALFWPSGQDAIFAVEVNRKECNPLSEEDSEDEEMATMRLIALDPDTGNRAEKGSVQIACNESHQPHGDNAPQVNFDPLSESVEFDGHLIKGANYVKYGAVFDLLPTATEDKQSRLILFSPDGWKFVRFSYENKGTLLIVDRKTMTSSTVFEFMNSSQCSIDWKATSRLAWSADGETLYFPWPNLSENGCPVGFGIGEYKVSEGRARKLVRDDVLALATSSSLEFPQRLLAFFDSAGADFATVLDGDAHQIRKFAAPYMGLDIGHMPKSLKISPQGNYAAVLFSGPPDRLNQERFDRFISPYSELTAMLFVDPKPWRFLPALIDLTSGDIELLRESNGDALLAGDIYFLQHRYDLAIEMYEKEGDEALDRLYAVYYQMRRNEEAAAVYKKLMEVYSKQGLDPHLSFADRLIELSENFLLDSDVDLTYLAFAEYKKAGKDDELRALLRAGLLAMDSSLAEEFKGECDLNLAGEDGSPGEDCISKAINLLAERSCENRFGPGCLYTRDFLDLFLFARNECPLDSDQCEKTFRMIEGLDDLYIQALSDELDGWEEYLYSAAFSEFLIKLYQDSGRCDQALNQARLYLERKEMGRAKNEWMADFFLDSARELVSKVETECREQSAP